jgi:hypothetical protein
MCNTGRRAILTLLENVLLFEKGKDVPLELLLTGNAHEYYGSS